MASVTLALSDEVKGEMEGFSWVNWSELARKGIIKRINRFRAIEKLIKITKKSKLTESDVKELTDKVNEAVAKHYKGE